MRKIALLILVVMIIINTVACAEKSHNNFEGSLDKIMDEIYEKAQVSESFRDYIENGTEVIEVEKERNEYFFGLKDIRYEEAIASEPIIQPGAYSLVLIRVLENDNIEEIKNKIKENVDPNKWICVGVDPQNVIIDSVGDIVFLVMSDEEATTLHQAFISLKE